jgi:arginyl-tRNA synthetase
MKARLNNILKETIEYCYEEGLLKRSPLPEYVIEVPNNPGHGHFATNLPMKMASVQRRAPAQIAAVIVDNLVDSMGLLEKAEVAGPGFINFSVKKEAWLNLVGNILAAESNYGQSRIGEDQKILVEFVSANPTGPLHLGHGRGAAYGDTLCNILSKCGYKVVREFYINDAGRQVRMLGESIMSRWRQLKDPEYPFPEDGYKGEYILDLALKADKDLDSADIESEQGIQKLAEWGKDRMLEEIKEDLALFRVDFDHWYSESQLFASGLMEKTMEEMKAGGELYEEEGALWIRTSVHGDDKDRVIRKSDGEYTYFASDISYHLDKFKRGYSRAINIWGADHHGYVNRVKAALKSHGVDPDWLTILFIQLAKLWREGQEIRMSKRAGQYVTLKDLIEEVGVDAVRFVFLTKSHDSPLDFDVDLIKKHDSDNPVYYVQYAHARICSIFRKAEEEGLKQSQKPEEVLNQLHLEDEMAMIRLLADFPSLLEDICRTSEVHRLTYFLTDLSARFHKYFNLGLKNPQNRVITGDHSLSQARLFLLDAIRIVIHNGLELLGVQAPERM